MSDLSYKNRTDITDKAMREFAIALAKLSKKTGIMIDTIGGVSYDNPKDIKDICYSDDFSSGDLDCQVTFKDGVL